MPRLPFVSTFHSALLDYSISLSFSDLYTEKGLLGLTTSEKTARNLMTINKIFLSFFTGSLMHEHYTRECEFGNFDKIKKQKTQKKQNNTKNTKSDSSIGTSEPDCS